jgi:hypothetical protein
MDHARIAVVEKAKRCAVAVAGRAHKRVILARFGNGPKSHSLKFHACGPKVNGVSQFHAIRRLCFLQ